MRQKKEGETSKDMQIRYLADGTTILPVVNDKPIYPELAAKVAIMDEVLRALASFNPDIFGGDAADQIKGLIHHARHFCDLYGLDYTDIDRLAHMSYSQDRWLAHAEHEGEKS